MTELQKIFALSTVNGQDNRQDLLPVNGWQFPKDTWLAKRLKEVRGNDGNIQGNGQGLLGQIVGKRQHAS